MKQLVQIIALNLFGVNALQIIAAIGITVMLLQIVLNKFGGSRRKWKIKKRNKDLENNMWAIE